MTITERLTELKHLRAQRAQDVYQWRARFEEAQRQLESAARDLQLIDAVIPELAAFAESDVPH